MRARAAAADPSLYQLPILGYLEQADGTAWVALYAQNMLEIAVQLAANEPAYEELATNVGIQFC